MSKKKSFVKIWRAFLGIATGIAMVIVIMATAWGITYLISGGFK